MFFGGSFKEFFPLLFPFVARYRNGNRNKNATCLKSYIRHRLLRVEKKEFGQCHPVLMMRGMDVKQNETKKGRICLFCFVGRERSNKEKQIRTSSGFST